MTAHRRFFSVTEHDGAWLIRAGGRYVRLNADEAAELVTAITGKPTIQRYVIGQP